MFEHEKKETQAYFRRKKLDLDRYNEVLGDWYGQDRAAREITSKLPEPISLSQSLDKLVNGLVKPADRKLMDVKGNWEALVGPQIAEIAHPVKIFGGVIYVEVVHNAWLRELKGGTKDLIIKNINKYCGDSFCKDIRFTPAGRGK